MEVDAPNSVPVEGQDSLESSLFADVSAARNTRRTAAPARDIFPPAVEEPVRRDTAAAAEPAKAQTAEDIAAGMRKLYREFEQFVQAYTAPALAASAWKFLAVGDQRLRLDLPGLEFAQAVRDEYNDELVVWLGLFTQIGEQLQPAVWLNHSPLFVNVDVENFKVDFTFDAECLFPVERSALDLAVECIDAESTTQTRALFVVESDDAADVLRRIGLAAVSCEGLFELDRHDLSRLFSGDYRSDNNWRYNLLLVDFDVWAVTNKRLPTIGRIVERLADAADVFDIDPGRRFGICRPTAEEFQLLERAITFGDPPQIALLFEKWASAAKQTRIINWRTCVETESTTLSATRAALVRAVTRQDLPFCKDEIRRALAAYRASCADPIITRFYKAAEQEVNPFDQLDLIAAAEFAHDYFSNDPLARRAEAILLGQNPPSMSVIREEGFGHQQKCLAQLWRIQRGRKGKC